MRVTIEKRLPTYSETRLLACSSLVERRNPAPSHQMATKKCTRMSMRKAWTMTKVWNVMRMKSSAMKTRKLGKRVPWKAFQEMEAWMSKW